jgi:type II secretory pathway pseudopilin PulG
MQRRAGFTLVEVLIAVFLIDVGLLALVAAGSILVRRAAEVRLRGAAVRAAVDRLQSLGVGPCGSVSGTFANGNGLRELWSAASPASGIRELSDSVVFTINGFERSIALRTRSPC